VITEAVASPAERSEHKAPSFSSERQNLAGMLEKKSRWRKEWNYRFFVMRHDRIDYYLSPPTLMEDEDTSSRKGSIPLAEAVATRDEAGRPYCISVGSELLSCQSLIEQGRWLDTINAASVVLARSRLPPEKDMLATDLTASRLMLLPLDTSGDMIPLHWHKMYSVSVSGRQSSATLLFVSSGMQAACQLPLFDSPAGSSPRARISLLTEVEHESSCRLNLCFRVHENDIKAASETQRLSSLAMGVCVLAIALLMGNSTRLALCAIVAVCALLLYEAQLSPHLPQRHIKFSVEKVESASLVPVLATEPRWVGKWRLDKSCSDSYSPILQDMGVNFVLRRLVEAATPTLTFSVDPTHLTIHLKIWVLAEVPSFTRALSP